MAGKTMVVQGLGNVGSNAALISQQEGDVNIIGVSEREGSIYGPNGIDVEKLLAFRKDTGSIIGFPGTEHVGDALAALEIECDILVPAAKEDQITAHNADRIKAKLIVEGANGPISADADDIIAAKGTRVIPDILANSGGVIVSYFEWVQDRIGYFWDEDDVNARLNRMMTEAFDAVYNTAIKYDTTFRLGAYIYAIDKVSKVLKLRGIYG